MATFRNDFRTGYAVQINWWVNSQNISANTSNITVQAQLISTGSSYTIKASATKYGTLYVNGTPYNFTFNASLSGGETKTVYTINLDIPHDSNGYKECWMSLDLGIEVTLSGVKWNTVSTSGTAYFPTIARASQITSITGDYFGDNMTVTIDRKSSNFTTSVWLKVGNSDWWNVVWKQYGDSFTFTIPIDLVGYLPQHTSTTATVKIRTYSGDTEIGDCDWGKWLGVPDWIAPYFTEVKLDTTGLINGQWLFIQWKSQLRVRPSATTSYGAWITDYRIQYDGREYWGNDIHTGVQSIEGTRGVTVTVWDSRGRSATWYGEVYVHPYQNPWGSISVYRCDVDGVRNDSGGTYVKVSFSGDKSWVNGANTFALAIDHRETGWADWSPIDHWQDTTGSREVVLGSEFSRYDIDKTYEVRLKVSDWYTTTYYTVPVGTAFVLMDFRAGGTGLGIGRICTEDNVLQIQTPLKMYAGGTLNDPNVGADLTFNNVSKDSQVIGWCGGTPSSDNLMVLNRFTRSDAGYDGALMWVDRWNVAYHNFAVNYFANNITFYASYGGIAERQMRFNNSASYLFFHNPSQTGHGLGAYNDHHGAIWEFNHNSAQLLLKAGYGTVSDGRRKHNFDEFTNWDDYYNFYMSLKPKTFKYNEDIREETHIGLVAQEVGDSIVENNLNNEKLCLVKCHENEDFEDGREYTVAYQELISLNIKMIQKHEEEILELKAIIKEQQELINNIRENINTGEE